MAKWELGYTSFKSCPREGASAALHHGHLALAGFKSCPREGASKAEFTADLPSIGFKSCPREGASRLVRVFIPFCMFQVMPP